MTDKDFLRIELELLVLRCGRKAVIDAVSMLEGTTAENLEKEIQRRKANKKIKLPRVEKTAEDILGLLNVDDESRRTIMSLVEKFRSKVYLPNLRDAVTFLHRAGVARRNLKSRQDALIPIIKALSEMSKAQLHTIQRDLQDYGGQSDFSLLANKLLGKPRQDT